MGSIERLKADARAKRDKAIRLARLDYRLTMAAIREAARLLKKRPLRSLRPCFKPPTDENGDLAGYTGVAAAEVVLREHGPLAIPEITALVQQRGCRTGDHPQRLANNIRGAFGYHRERFRRLEDGRWGLALVE